jgi:hypothetical protein
MLFEVDRTYSYGSCQLAQFAPTDFLGAYFTMQVSWPLQPGGDWYFGANLEDSSGRAWQSPRVHAPNPSAPADPNTSRVPWRIGPIALPAAWQNAFDPSAVTQIWFECWVSAITPNQQFLISVDTVNLGPPASTAAWSLVPNVLPPAAQQTIFGGYIVSVAMADAGALDGSVDVTYSCRGYRLFTDARQWNKDYTQLAMTDAQIIQDILTGTGLVPSIFSYGAIVSTGIVALNFAYQTVTQCLNAIANATGLVWSIDANGVFSYVQPDAQPVFIALTDQPGGIPFKVDNYAEDFYAPANDITFVGDGVTAHVYDQSSIDKYGRLQWVDYDMRVTQASTALLAAQTDLAESSVPKERAQLRCWQVGALPGNIVSATAARYGWSNKAFEVQRVQLQALGDAGATTQVVLSVGDYNPTLADAVAEIAKSVNATAAGGV